jgi:predicted N-acetyltransferase YhbS
MTGPRSVTPEELPALSDLVDRVFNAPAPGTMFQHFSQLFSVDNARNLLVFEDDGAVVAHAGMTQRGVSILGCQLRVACVGAVSTDPAYQGRGLATQLMDAACSQARADGVDLMMISGGRGLYRRLGAADVGCDYKLRIPRERVDAQGGVSVRPFSSDYLPACKAAYANKPVHFIRPDSDWQDYSATQNLALRETAFTVITRNDEACGYVVTFPENDGTALRVAEFAGAPADVASALGPLMGMLNAQEIGLHLQACDEELRNLLADGAAALVPASTTGTLLFINIGQAVARLGPVLGDAAGAHHVAEAFHFERGGESVAATNMHDATQFVFGHHDACIERGPFMEVLPIPAPWYGLNYV